jgi:hypothetical protein
MLIDTQWLITDDIFVEVETGNDFNIYKYKLNYKFILRNMPIFESWSVKNWNLNFPVFS